MGMPFNVIMSGHLSVNAYHPILAKIQWDPDILLLVIFSQIAGKRVVIKVDPIGPYLIWIDKGRSCPNPEYLVEY